jgi:surfeit locus 1 family protein
LRAYGVLIGGVLAAAVCVRLGFWQVSRLHQRQAVRAMVEARQRQPEFELTGRTAFQAWTLEGEDAMAYRPAVASGVFDFARQIVLVARSVDHIPAVYIVTPLRLADGPAILVERGWVPSPDAYTVPLDSLEEPDSARVAGLLLRYTASRDFTVPDSTWPLTVPSPDPEKVAGRYPYRLLPWVLRRGQPGPAAPAPPALRPIPLPVIDNGPHLSYAIQWFAFATIALVGSAALFRREKRTGKAGG